MIGLSKFYPSIRPLYKQVLPMNRLYLNSCRSKNLISINPINFHNNKHYFSTISAIKNKIKPIHRLGYLKIRNSQNLQLNFVVNNEQKSCLVQKSMSLQECKAIIQDTLNLNDVKFLCDQGTPISQLTPIQSLLNQLFFIQINNQSFVKIQGTMLMPVQPQADDKVFENLQLPLITKQELINYWKRVKTLIQSKHGYSTNSRSVKLSQQQAKSYLIQGLLSDNNTAKHVLLEQRFEQLYWQVQKIKDKKKQVHNQCRKMVKIKMSIGIVLILMNIAFIWSGTYVFFSWDIIEPLAYFVSSLAAMILFSRFFKLKRPFSLVNYREYLMERTMPKAMKKLNFNLEQFEQKQRQLLELQSEIKDFYLKKIG